MSRQENNKFGAHSKPQGRAVNLVLVILFIVLDFAVKKIETKEIVHFLVFAAALNILRFAVADVVGRWRKAILEIRQKRTRNQGDWMCVLKSVFSIGYNRYILVAAVGSTLTVCYTLYENFSRRDYDAIISLMKYLVVSPLLVDPRLRFFDEDHSEKREKENKSIAEGLAWSYYFGYLQLVLPRLKDNISRSEEFRYKITKEKLFILVPETCYPYCDLTDADSRLKWAGCLPNVANSRAGFKGRYYKHHVHRIEMPRRNGRIDQYHFVVEYATPIMTLYDMSNHEHGPWDRQERDHEVNF